MYLPPTPQEIADRMPMVLEPLALQKSARKMRPATPHTPPRVASTCTLVKSFRKFRPATGNRDQSTESTGQINREQCEEDETSNATHAAQSR